MGISDKIKVATIANDETTTFIIDRVGQGGSGIPVYPKKIRQNTQKYPKFIQIYPKLYPGILYT